MVNVFKLKYYLTLMVCCIGLVIQAKDIYNISKSNGETDSCYINEKGCFHNSGKSAGFIDSFLLFRNGIKMDLDKDFDLDKLELEPGNYVLKYYSEKHDTNQNSVILRFTVKESILESKPFKFIAIIFLFLMFGLAYFSRYRFIKKESQTRQLILEKEHYQIQLLKSQLNPHFLFNALNTLKAMVYVGQKSHSLSYIDKLSIFLRHVLNTNKELYTSLENELKLIENYLEIEKCRLNEKLNYTILADDGTRVLQIPSNILQPIVENSIKYGLGLADEGLNIQVLCKLELDRLEIKVSDNGPGPSERVNSSSFSTESIRRRINVFNGTILYEALMIKPIKTYGKISGTQTIISLIVKAK